MPNKINLKRGKSGFRLKDKAIFYGRNYLKNSNLHGSQYIIDKKYSTGISICWALLLTTSFVFCFYLIFLQLNRFQRTAVINTISSTGYPVWKNPFPAVTICNNNIVYKNKTGTLIRALSGVSVQENDTIEFLENLSKLILCMDCDDEQLNFNIKKQVQIENDITTIGYDVAKFMETLAHPCETMLKKCIWKSEEKPCMSFFRPIKTTLGYCCAFNYFGIAEYQRYYDKALFNGGFGINSGLQVIIDVEPDQYMSTVNTVPGVNVLVKHGLKFAEFGTDSYSISIGHTMSVSVEPSVFKGDGDLKYLKDVTRACWFYNEGNLKWTTIYNHLTCFNECKANYIFKTCKCIPFYYALIGEQRICTFKDLQCLIHNRSIFASLMLASNLEEANNTEITNSSAKRFCYCLPSCDDVYYNLHKDNTVNVKLDNDTTCRLYVYFNNVSGILRLRTVHVTWDTLLAIIGGLFGLCVGGSVITLFELMFFLLQTIFRKSYTTSNKHPFTH